MSEKEIVLWYYAHIWKIVYFVGRLIGLQGLGGGSPCVGLSVDAARPKKMSAAYYGKSLIRACGDSNWNSLQTAKMIKCLPKDKSPSNGRAFICH